jgi:hypothetical protein
MRRYGTYTGNFDDEKEVNDSQSMSKKDEDNIEKGWWSTVMKDKNILL